MKIELSTQEIKTDLGKKISIVFKTEDNYKVGEAMIIYRPYDHDQIPGPGPGL